MNLGNCVNTNTAHVQPEFATCPIVNFAQPVLQMAAMQIQGVRELRAEKRASKQKTVGRVGELILKAIAAADHTLSAREVKALTGLRGDNGWRLICLFRAGRCKRYGEPKKYTYGPL